MDNNSDKILLEIVTPEEHFTSQHAEMVVIPASEGEMGILVDHVPMVVKIPYGNIKIYEGDEVTQKIFIYSGFGEVTATTCTILAEYAINAEDVDFGQLQEEIIALKNSLEGEENSKEIQDITKKIEIAEAMVNSHE